MKPANPKFTIVIQDKFRSKLKSSVNNDAIARTTELTSNKTNVATYGSKYLPPRRLNTWKKPNPIPATVAHNAPVIVSSFVVRLM